MTNWLILTSAVSPEAVNTAKEAANNDYTVLFSIISLLVCIAIPTAVFLLGILKYEGSFKMTLWGILGYIVFSVILYALVSRVIFHNYLDQTATSFEAVVLILVRIVCEAAGMFLLLLWTKKKRKGLGNALMFGGGYCLLECLIVGILLVSYLVVMTSEDVEKVYFLRTLRVFVQSNNLVAGEEWKFIVKALTAAVFCALQLSSAAVMFVAVHTKKYWLAGAAVLFGVVIRLPNRLSSFDAWFWGNNAVILPYLAIMAVMISVIAYVIWRSNQSELTQKEGLK